MLHFAELRVLTGNQICVPLRLRSDGSALRLSPFARISTTATLRGRQSSAIKIVLLTHAKFCHDKERAPAGLLLNLRYSACIQPIEKVHIVGSARYHIRSYINIFVLMWGAQD